MLTYLIKKRSSGDRGTDHRFFALKGNPEICMGISTVLELLLLYAVDFPYHRFTFPCVTSIHVECEVIVRCCRFWSSELVMPSLCCKPLMSRTAGCCRQTIYQAQSRMQRFVLSTLPNRLLCLQALLHHSQLPPHCTSSPTANT